MIFSLFITAFLLVSPTLAVPSNVLTENVKVDISNISEDGTTWANWLPRRVIEEAFGITEAVKTELAAKSIKPKIPKRQVELKNEKNEKPMVIVKNGETVTDDERADTPMVVGVLGTGGNGMDGLLTLLNLWFEGYEIGAWITREADQQEATVFESNRLPKDLSVSLASAIKYSPALKGDQKVDMDGILEILRETASESKRRRDASANTISKDFDTLLKLLKDKCNLALFDQRQPTKVATPEDANKNTQQNEDKFEGSNYFDKFKNIVAVLDGIAGSGTANSKIFAKAHQGLKVLKSLQGRKENNEQQLPLMVAVDMASFEDHLKPLVLEDGEVESDDPMHEDRHRVVIPDITVVINGFRSCDIPAAVQGVRYYVVVPGPVRQVLARYVRINGRTFGVANNVNVTTEWNIWAKSGHPHLPNYTRIYSNLYKLNQYYELLQVVKT